MTIVDELLTRLRTLARPDQLSGMAKFGLTGAKRLGVAVPEMRKLAKQIGKSHPLALELWQTQIPEAMMVASMIDDPKQVTGEQMDAWVKDFQAWDVCDQVCMNLFEKTPLAWQKVVEWSSREEEFVKRAAFALIACLAWHDKKANDQAFVDLLPLIKAQAGDGRNYVKKAVSWALRHIGKRNAMLHPLAIATAHELQEFDSKTARWIASDTLRDLASEATQRKINKGGVV